MALSADNPDAAAQRRVSVEEAARFVEQQATGLMSVAARAGVSPAAIIADRMRDELAVSSPRTVHRVAVTFSQAAWADLNALADAKQTDIGAVISDALALARWFDDQHAAGNRILVQDACGRLRQVLAK